MYRGWRVAALLGLAACSGGAGPTLTIDGGGPDAGVKTVDFGPTLIGESSVVELSVGNTARSAGRLAATATPGFFTVLDGGGQLIAAGGRGTLRLGFAPTAQGEARGKLHLSFGDLGKAQDVELTGTGGNLDLKADSSIDFGLVRVGARAKQTLHVHNQGLLRVTLTPEVTGTYAGDFELGAGIISLPPSADGSLDVTFSPGSRGSVAATIVLTPCHGCEPTNVALTGEGADQLIDASPSVRDMGDVGVGETVAHDVALTSREELATWVSSITLVDGAGSPFSFEAPATPFSLEGGHQLVHVHFSPKERGPHQARLLVETSNGTLPVPLTGNGTGTALTAAPEALDFGFVPVGMDQLAHVKLAGANVTLGSVTVQGDAAVKFTLPRIPVAFSSMLDVPITFGAATVGVHQATVVFDPGLDGQVTFSLPVTGEVVQGGVCSLTAPPELDFGAVAPGEVVSRTLLVRNDGDSSCTIGDVQLAGDSSFALVTATDPRILLDPGGSLSFDVTFKAPPDAGARKALLRFRQTSARLPLMEIPVTAEVGGGLAADGPIDLGTVAAHDTGLGTVVIHNRAHAPARITSAVLDPASSHALTILQGPTAEIGPQGSEVVTILIEPVDATPMEGLLMVQQEGVPAPLLVPLRATPGPDCSGSCPTDPKIDCPPTLSVPAFDYVHVNVGAWGERIVTGCTYAVSGPPAADVRSSTDTPCSFDAVVGGPGLYPIDVTAMDTIGGEATCRVNLAVTGSPRLVVRATGAPGNDVDLRLLHAAAGAAAAPASWKDPALVCFEGDPAPSWDAAGVADDPVLHRGHGSVPSVLRIDAPATTHLDTAGVRWSAASGVDTSLFVTTEVICGGQSAGTTSTTLADVFQAAPVYDIAPAADGSCQLGPRTGKLEVLP